MQDLTAILVQLTRIADALERAHPNTAPEPTHEDLAECFKALMRKDKAYKPLLKNLLDDVGAARTSEVKPDDIAQLIKSAEALTL